jgi:cytochrome c2
MKKFIIAPLLMLTVVISCNTRKDKSFVLQTPGDIKADEYVISIDRDTTLVTINGALLKIPKGSLSTDNGSTVTLEIKEAYSLEQMMKGGLDTKANGELLSSGGMIYINAKAGQNVTIKQAIQVAIPTDHLRDSMQLFKGEKDQAGNINWTSPKKLPVNKQLSAIQRGKQLFQTKCASCHAIGKEMTGPDLAHFPKRFPYGEQFAKYYEHWYHYSKPATDHAGKDVAKKDSVNKVEGLSIDMQRDTSIILSPVINTEEDDYYYDMLYHTYKCNLVRRFGSIGPTIRSETGNPDDPNSIYKYIQNESNRRKLPLPWQDHLFKAADSCNVYENTINFLQQQKELAEQKKKGLIKQNGASTQERQAGGSPNISTGNNSVTPPPPPRPANYDDKVSPENNEAVYYQFSIETFGWYNIDILLKEVNGNQESQLLVRIVGQYREKLDIFLIIPSSKVYVRGGPTERVKDEYAFADKNGKIFLPQNVTAYILAVKETESSIAYTVSEFTTHTKQEFEISLQGSNIEAFNRAIKIIGNDRIQIAVTETKNAESIRKTSEDIKTINEELKKAESLKPKNCDCDCGSEGNSSIRGK